MNSRGWREQIHKCGIKIRASSSGQHHSQKLAAEEKISEVCRLWETEKLVPRNNLGIQRKATLNYGSS